MVTPVQSPPALSTAPTPSKGPRTWSLLISVLLGLGAIGLGVGCSTSSDETAASGSVSDAVERTQAIDSGRIVSTLTTSNPARFLRGELQYRYDGDDAQSSVSVATNATGAGAVVVDSSLIEGVGAQRWPLTEVWTSGTPRFPDPAIEKLLTIVAGASDAFASCPSNIDGVSAYCTSIDNVAVVDTTLEAFNISRSYTSADPVELTVWVDQDTDLLNAVFVEATNASDGSETSGQTSDEVDFELRYSLIGEPAVFSPIDIVCADFETEVDYITCMGDLGVDPVPPWNG